MYSNCAKDICLKQKMHKIPQLCVCALFFLALTHVPLFAPPPLLFVPILITATDNPIVTEQQQQQQPTALEVGGSKYTTNWMHCVSVRVCERVCVSVRC